MARFVVFYQTAYYNCAKDQYFIIHIPTLDESVMRLTPPQFSHYFIYGKFDVQIKSKGQAMNDLGANLLDANPDLYGTHSMRRTKATIIYQQTKNI